MRANMDPSCEQNNQLVFITWHKDMLALELIKLSQSPVVFTTNLSKVSGVSDCDGADLNLSFDN